MHLRIGATANQPTIRWSTKGILLRQPASPIIVDEVEAITRSGLPTNRGPVEHQSNRLNLSEVI